MKKKWSIIMAVLLAVVILATTVAPALAQSEDEVTADGRRVIRDGLALVVPIAGAAGQPMTMTVLKRSDASPAPGALVFAVTHDRADALHERISAMRESGDIA